MAISEKDQSIIDAVADTDEPIFVLRGKDILAASIIAQYHTQFQKHGPDNSAFLTQVSNRLKEFQDWQNANTNRVRYPD